MTAPQRSALVERIARGICECRYGPADDIEPAYHYDAVSQQMATTAEPLWKAYAADAEAILAAIHDAGYAVVPRETTEAMREASYGFERECGFVGELAPRGMNHSTVWEKMVAVADLAAPKEGP